jgi:hypothetical protein
MDSKPKEVKPSSQAGITLSPDNSFLLGKGALLSSSLIFPSNLVDCYQVRSHAMTSYAWAGYKYGGR